MRTLFIMLIVILIAVLTGSWIFGGLSWLFNAISMVFQTLEKVFNIFGWNHGILN